MRLLFDHLLLQDRRLHGHRKLLICSPLDHVRWDAVLVEREGFVLTSRGATIATARYGNPGTNFGWKGSACDANNLQQRAHLHTSGRQR